VFKLGIGNDLFWVERSKVNARVRVRVQQCGVGSNSMSAFWFRET